MISDNVLMACCRLRPARFFLLVPFCILVMAAGGAEPGAEQRRARVDLNGTWEFRMDPKDKGVAGQWFTADAPYPDKIKVPGCWQAQGFGPPRGHLRHDYQGKAWYRRTVAVPAGWAGRRIWVHIGAASNTADVYVNGKKVGHVEGFLTPYEFDATDAVKPGAENVIACCVDSAGPAPVGMFNFIGRWGGLNREVFLEARSDPAIDDVFVIPDVKTRTARTQVVLRRHAAGEGWEGDLSIKIQPTTEGAASEGKGKIRFAAGEQQSEPAVVDVPIEDMHTWSPEDPFLYTVRVALSAKGKLIDMVRDRFGMRQFEVGPGGVLLLNGRPYFVRGLGDDSVEVITGIQYPDKQIYVDRLKMIKRYGFNGIRFLSHTPIKEYFEAADEVGILLLCDGEIYRKPKDMIPLLKKQVTRIAKAYRNHPSWYAFSSGNELFECQGATPDREWMDYILYAHKTFKGLDPTRFFIGSEGANVFPTDIITQRGRFAGPPPAADQPFDGLIDEVAYFRRALTEEEMIKTADRDDAEYPRTIKSLGPSGYWRLEETSPPRAIDSSGNGNHGVFDSTMKAADFKQPGALEPWESSRAIHVSTTRKGVHLKDVAAKTFAAGNDPFSVSLWVKPSGFGPGDYGTPFAYGAAGKGAALLIAEDGKNGIGQLRLGKFNDDFLMSGGAMAAGLWNHIGISYDGVQLKLYINGKLDGSAKVKMATVPADGRIGASVTRMAVKPGPTEDVQDLYASRPHIWHEFPNRYVGPLPDLTIMDKWTGVFRDDNCISYHRRQIAELGLAGRYPSVHRRSVDHFYLYLKDTFERARHSTTMDGYGYWCFTDFPGGPEGDMTTYGMFSTVYEPEKFPDPAPVRQFNRETVLLIHTPVGQRVLKAEEPRSVTLSISHYGPKAIRDGRLPWAVKLGEKTLQEGTLEPINAEPGEVKQIGTISLGPYQIDSARRLRLVVSLESEACRQGNHWDFWGFPAGKPNLRVAGVVNLTGVKELDERYGIKTPTPREQARLVVANGITPEVLKCLEHGKAVLLLGEDGALARPRGLSFWPQWIRSTGTFIEDHPALEGFAHDGFCAYQFIRLFGRGLKTLDITEKGAVGREKLTPIVWGLTQDPDPKGAGSWANVGNRWKIFRHGIVCEGRVADGKLLVCCLRVLGGLQARQPEAGYLLDCLVEYGLSDKFAPSSPPMTAEELKQVFRISTSSSR